MKIKAICENIKKADFYDFYLLQYINTVSNISDGESERYFKYLVDFILDDHLNQLANIALNRIPDIDHKETSELIERYGLKLNDEYHYEGLDLLNLNQKVALLIEILSYNREHGFTGKTWLWIGRTVVKLTRIYSTGSLIDKMNAIDEIYNLLHHGGKISDYMDERNWLEDALNIRDNSNIRYIFSQASSYVKKIIGRPMFSNDDNINITEIDKLYTVFVRLTHKEQYAHGIKFKKQDNKLIINVNFTPIMMDYGTGLKRSPWVAYGGVLTKQAQRLIDYKNDKQQFWLGDNIDSIMTIEEFDNYLTVTSDTNSVKINKPINRHLNIAYDVVTAATMEDKKLRIGHCVSDIKPSYYVINGRPVKQN